MEQLMTQPNPTLSIPEEIVSERVVLRPPREEDAEAIIAAIDASRPELEAWMDWAPSMRTAEDAHEFARRVQETWRAGDEFSLGIFRRSDGSYLGGTGMHRPTWSVPSVEIGYWMSTPETGKGYVREAVTALTRLGFGQLGLRRMVITCAATNDRSRRVAEAVGYQLEGRLRNHGRLPDGSLRDTFVFSLIDTDDAVKRLLRES
jgi:RimJ/RimL family protein N-acetyltransferase